MKEKDFRLSASAACLSQQPKVAPPGARLVREAEHQELDDYLYQLLIAQLKEADLLTPQSLKAYEPEHEYFKNGSIKRSLSFWNMAIWKGMRIHINCRREPKTQPPRYGKNGSGKRGMAQ
ncbi:hypothetical protein QNN00_18640 [Bacillus velezensis]|nr:hypothetical protein [Bacillus velezensis]